MFFVALNDPAGREIERWPPGRPIEVAATTGRFLAFNWSA
jgi:hypothetical protein